VNIRLKIYILCFQWLVKLLKNILWRERINTDFRKIYGLCERYGVVENKTKDMRIYMIDSL
jgi:hypothetical protein